ncbi:sensor histidine kinase [Blautia sp. NSJ-166]|uniref:sensor histidine kinase n=1 Tax=Blautia sp. NSJ-166 TaxID=2931882 RepID=UPI000E5C9560|nr:ATP-binding protein [Blautia sp. NSJ-166]MCJ8044984.1 ATP-binding protein [Blautia sp. NSJ-166]RGF84866.1 response regulator [Ruminococcus sp. OF03-6AA]
MIKKDNTSKQIRIYCLVVGIISFFIVSVCGQLLNRNTVNEEKMRAAFTAETTVNRIRSQLNRYLDVSEFFQNIIESGHQMDSKEFQALSQMISDDSQIIKAIELAPDGVVKDIYPLKGNEAAFGIDMLNSPARKHEANLAMKSGQYTIAGPYELNQGGLGSLLFEPIYITDKSGEKSFWGFSILVLDWNRFLEELELDKLTDASYCYQMWKKDGNSGKKTIIAQGGDAIHKGAVQISCKVPNDTWYFEIIPHTGWVTVKQQALVFLVAVSIAVLATAICYLMLHRKQREKLYTEEIRKSAEKARKANEAKTRFLFNMSHDIRTPMNAIVGFSGLLEKSIHDEKKSLDYIKKIRVSSDILLTIINQVLEMARIESGKITLSSESVNIREMVEAMNTVFESSLTKKSLEYQCSLNVVHDQILCDKTKMEEIILNVVSNSIKYTNPHGKITVSIDELDSEDEKNANYKVVVEDNGIGMSQDYLPHIFEEFSREHTSTETRVAGTGLGLPIVKSLVDRMGGTIEVESEEGKGTRFIMKFSFPVSLENQVREKEKQNIPDITEKLEGKRILLAEDNELNAEIAETVLEETGIKVKHVEDGIQCIEELKKMPEKYYDVILMDVQMPNMDGYTATQRIRDLDDSRAEIPIIAMTANAYDEDRRKAQEAGMDGFLAKPLDVDEMMRLLAQIIKTE